jgi:hypothetical protein
VYLCFVNDDRCERHLSLVPQFEGSEALCGQRITAGDRITWVGAMHMVTCVDCKKTGMSFGPRAETFATTGIKARASQRHVAALR